MPASLRLTGAQSSSDLRRTPRAPGRPPRAGDGRSAALEADQPGWVRPRHRHDVRLRNTCVPQGFEEADEVVSRTPETVAEAVVGRQRATVRSHGGDPAGELLRARALDVQGRDVL